MGWTHRGEVVPSCQWRVTPCGQCPWRGMATDRRYHRRTRRTIFRRCKANQRGGGRHPIQHGINNISESSGDSARCITSEPNTTGTIQLNSAGKSDIPQQRRGTTTSDRQSIAVLNGHDERVNDCKRQRAIRDKQGVKCILQHISKEIQSDLSKVIYFIWAFAQTIHFLLHLW